MIVFAVSVILVLFVLGLCKASSNEEEAALAYIRENPPRERFQFALVSNSGELIDWCWADNVVEAEHNFAEQGRKNNDNTYITNLTAILEGDYE